MTVAEADENENENETKKTSVEISEIRIFILKAFEEMFLWYESKNKALGQRGQVNFRDVSAVILEIDVGAEDLSVHILDRAV